MLCRAAGACEAGRAGGVSAACGAGGVTAGCGAAGVTAGCEDADGAGECLGPRGIPGHKSICTIPWGVGSPVAGEAVMGYGSSAGRIAGASPGAVPLGERPAGMRLLAAGAALPGEAPLAGGLGLPLPGVELAVDAVLPGDEAVPCAGAVCSGAVCVGCSGAVCSGAVSCGDTLLPGVAPPVGDADVVPPAGVVTGEDGEAGELVPVAGSGAGFPARSGDRDGADEPVPAGGEGDGEGSEEAGGGSGVADADDGDEGPGEDEGADGAGDEGLAHGAGGRLLAGLPAPGAVEPGLAGEPGDGVAGTVGAAVALAPWGPWPCAVPAAPGAWVLAPLAPLVPPSAVLPL